MPIFISYSHTDAEFVNKLAADLVKKNAHVWVDSWELNVGDSILNKVQQAIQESSALLVVLSKASVVSEWCKKEISAALMRELDEKRVVVLPVLLDDCEIPLFLREKMYADFRKNYSIGFKAISEAVARVTTQDQGRIVSSKGNTDWAEDWGFENQLFRITYTLIESYVEHPFSILTQITLHCNHIATKRYQQYADLGLEWFGRLLITEVLIDLADAHDVRLILENQLPKTFEARLKDSKSDAFYDVNVVCRRMGEDNGKDQLINISNYLRQIRDYVRSIARKLTNDEVKRVAELIMARQP